MNKVSKVSMVSMGYNANGNELQRVDVLCPYCGSRNTELFALFGQQLLTIQYYCNTCHTPFECIKDDEILDDYGARKESEA